MPGTWQILSVSYDMNVASRYEEGEDKKEEKKKKG